MLARPRRLGEGREDIRDPPDAASKVFNVVAPREQEEGISMGKSHVAYDVRCMRGQPAILERGVRYRMDGRDLLANIAPGAASAVFFDPQYRGLLDKMSYGNEGESRGRERCLLPQMTEDVITSFMRGISAALAPSGHLFLWIDKFHLCEGAKEWTSGLPLEQVDLIVWDKGRMGMGYRTRRRSEYLLVYQKPPKRAKGVWTDRAIPDIWMEKASSKTHTHAKPIGLQQALIEAVTRPGDLVVDPAAGSFSVLDACRNAGRDFIGGDIEKGEGVLRTHRRDYDAR